MNLNSVSKMGCHLSRRSSAQNFTVCSRPNVLTAGIKSNDFGTKVQLSPQQNPNLPDVTGHKKKCSENLFGFSSKEK